MCCAVAAKSSYRHASKIPHSLRQIGLSYRGFGKLWSAFGSFQPFITNDTVEPPTETLISRGNSTRLSVNYVKLKRASLSGRSYAVGRFSKLENAPSSSSLSSMRVTCARSEEHTSELQ